MAPSPRGLRAPADRRPVHGETDGLAQLPLPFPLEASTRFETFVVGENAALLAQLRSFPSDSPPLWLWGRPGSGKSHLLQACCAAAVSGAAIYLPLRDLPRSAPALLEGLESLDLVALDDVDAAAGDPAWEAALFSLFNALQGEGGRLLCAARSAPAGVEFALPDLGSRAAGAVVYQVRPLEDEQRIVALRTHARFRGIELPEDSARFLLHRVQRDMGALCEWLDTLDRASFAAQRRLTVPFIREHLE